MKTQAKTNTFKKEVLNSFYYPEYELNPKPKTVIRDLYVGMTVSHGIGGDSYVGKITDIKRNGNTIVVDGDTEYTYRASSFDYSRKGYNFGHIVFGVEVEKRDMDR